VSETKPGFNGNLPKSDTLTGAENIMKINVDLPQIQRKCMWKGRR